MASSSLVSSLRKKLDSLSHLSDQCCIYRVPTILREQNKKAYTPRAVSLGPLHHAQKHLEAMEEHKLRYLLKFLQLTGMGIEDAVEFIKEREVNLRNFYAESFKEGDDDEFVGTILVDATFLSVVLLSIGYPGTIELEYHFFRNPHYLIQDMMEDVLMLENQLPFFILADLLGKTNGFNPKLGWQSFVNTQMVKIFRNSLLKHTLDYNVQHSNARHFVDLLRKCLLPTKPFPKNVHKFDGQLMPSIIELHEAGVKFKARKGKSLLELAFNEGVLEIPPINLDELSETIFRNLVAFEHCHFVDLSVITRDHFGDGNSIYYSIKEYVVVMARLINTPMDVELLVEHEVMKFPFGNNQVASDIFKNLARGVAFDQSRFIYSDLCKKLNDHCAVSRHKWMANLKHEYFQSPWRTLSVIGAVVLLILTLIQTVCSILSVKHN